MAEHLWRLDDTTADVVVHGDPAAPGGGLHYGHRGVPTLTCAACGLRLAWLPTGTARVAAAHGLALDALVVGRPPKRCAPVMARTGGWDAGGWDADGREVGHG